MYAPVPLHRADGLSAHRRRLSDQLELLGDSVETATGAGSLGVTAYDVAHLHYVPFLYPGWGAGALSTVGQLRRRGKVVLTIHEARGPYSWRPRNIFFATLQAAILRRLVALADGIILTTYEWKRFVSDAEAVVIPSGSPLAPEDHPTSQRHEGLRVGMIGSGHETRMQGLAVEAIRTVAARLGAEASCIGETRPEGLESTGFLSDADFSRHLAALDLLVLPYSDGISSRRTTLAAASQLGVPTLTTVRLPQRDFPDTSAWACTDPRDRALFVETALNVAADEEWQARLRLASRALFEHSLSWGVLARSTRHVYESALS